MRFLDHVLYGVPLPATPPPGDATHTPTNLQLRRDPYLTGTPDRRSVYDTFYRGARFLMPWLGRVPGPADSQRQ